MTLDEDDDDDDRDEGEANDGSAPAEDDDALIATDDNAAAAAAAGDDNPTANLFSSATGLSELCITARLFLCLCLSLIGGLAAILISCNTGLACPSVCSVWTFKSKTKRQM